MNVCKMMEDVDLRFKSGNEIPVTWAFIHVDEWKHTKALANMAIKALFEGKIGEVIAGYDE